MTWPVAADFMTSFSISNLLRCSINILMCHTFYLPKLFSGTKNSTVLHQHHEIWKWIQKRLFLLIVSCMMATFMIERIQRYWPVPKTSVHNMLKIIMLLWHPLYIFPRGMCPGKKLKKTFGGVHNPKLLTNRLPLSPVCQQIGLSLSFVSKQHWQALLIFSRLNIGGVAPPEPSMAMPLYVSLSP